MPFDPNQVIDTLVKRGWNDDDVADVLKNMQDQTDELIKSGKSDDEIHNILQQTKIKDNQGDIELFNRPMMKEDFGFSTGVNANMQAYNENQDMRNIVQQGFKDIPVVQTGTALKDVKPPTAMQNIMSGPVGGAIELGLRGAAAPAQTVANAVRPLLPFPGLTKLFTGEDVSKYGTQGQILDPTPEIVSDTIGAGIEGLRKVSPGLSKLIGDTMMASPAFHEFATQSISNLRLYSKSKFAPIEVSNAPIDLSNVRDVSPGAEAAAGKLRLLESPLTNDRGPVNSQAPVSSAPPLKSQPSAKLGQMGEITPEIPAETIEIAKYARDYGIKISNPDIIARANEVLDKANVPEEYRNVTPQQADLSRTTAIKVADEAKRHAENVGDKNLINRANQIINNNGIIKTSQILNPSVHDLENFTADLNVIANNQPALDAAKLEGTAVVNPDGSPKILKHGTPSVFDKNNQISEYPSTGIEGHFDLAKAQPGLYGTGIYATESDLVTGGVGPDTITDVNTGKTYKAGNQFGYATPGTPDAIKTWTDSVRIFTDQVEKADTELTREIAQKNLDYAKDQVARFEKASSPNVRPVYMNIKDPYDIEKPGNGFGVDKVDAKRVGEAIIKYVDDYNNEISNFTPIRSDMIQLRDLKIIGDDLIAWANGEPQYGPTPEDNKHMYQVITEQTGNKDITNKILREAGFDGITHIGGGTVGNGVPHQVYIAFDPKQVISKFDPDLYSYKMADLVNNHYEIKNDKIVSVPNEFKELHDYSYLNTEWLNRNAEYLGKQQSVVDASKAQLEPVDQANADVGHALIKRAQEVGLKNPSGAPGINNLDYETLLENVFERPRDIPPDNFGGELPPFRDPFQLPPSENLNVRGITWLDKAAAPISVFNRLQAESKIPFLTELHNHKQIADARYTQMTLKLGKELKDIIREVGKYDKPTKANIAARERMSDILEEISYYDRKNDEIHFKNKGIIDVGSPVEMSAKTGFNLDEIKVAARLRWLYDEYYSRGATQNAGQYLDFYNPKKMDQATRMKYVSGLRDDERAFFTYPRTNRIYKTERDAITLINRYIFEWARTKHLIPWQKEIAEPIFEATKKAYKDSPRGAETINYVGNYILDTLRMPRDSAVNANTAMYDFVKNWIEPKSPYLAEAIFRRFGEDRLGEGISRGINNFFLNYYLRYRPVPSLRNMMQREFALPFLPGGNASLIKAQYQLLRSPEAQDKALLSGLMPYLEGGFANASNWDVFTWAEIGNMHSPFLVIHDGVLEDYKKGMSLADISEKWRLRFYPEAIQDEFRRLYKEGKIGDIRDIGETENGAALLGRYASMITQFPKGPGEVPEYARTGPNAKAAWLFSTWTPMSIDYFGNLLKDAVYAPTKGKKVMDLVKIGKIFAYLYVADKIWEGISGKSLQSNPFTNLPNRVVQAPGPTTAMNFAQYATSKWNEVINGIVDEDNASMYKWLKDQAWKNLTSSVPGAVKDFQYWTGGDKKNKAPKSIAP